MHDLAIATLPLLSDADVQALSDVLIDCVQGGASVSFLWPLSRERAVAHWREVAAAVARGERQVIVARASTGALLGTVQVILKLPENQPHRAELAKMLVYRSARRRGVGAALLQAAEQNAQRAGRSLLVLDTVSGAEGDRLYRRHGWQRCGEIPNYARWPDGRPCPTTVYYKQLRVPPQVRT